MKPFFIGITGGTGSGKSTFSQMASERYGKNILTISQDMYYKDQSDEPLEVRKRANMDCPDAVDFNLLISHVKALSKNESIQSPIYNFATHAREKETRTIEPQQIIIIEGLLVLAVKELRELLDLKIFIEVDSDLRVARRILRDVKEGRESNLEESINQYLSSAYPMHERYVEPQKRYADLIVPWNNMDQEAVETVVARIETELKSRGVLKD